MSFSTQSHDTPPIGRVVAAFATVYLVWGSTYLAIAVAVESIPPFMLAAMRFLSAGVVLYALARLGGSSRPTLREWRSTALVGLLMLMVGNGAVVWSETGDRVPSGVAALIVGTVPLWMVLVDWLRPGGVRPAWRVFAGLALGFGGLTILIAKDSPTGSRGVDLLGAAALAGGSLSWAIGSVVSRHVALPKNKPLSTAMQMLGGGLGLVVAATIHGDFRGFTLAAVSGRSWLALAYLVVFGSLLAFTAYVWLLQVSTPARVATYAYVNPVVAVALGWLMRNEPLTLRIALSAAAIVAGVVFITTAPVRRRAAQAAAAGDADRADPPARLADAPIESGNGRVALARSAK